MSCEQTREDLTAYLDGELEDASGSAVRGHLRTCEACRQVATDEAALRDGLRALPSVDPPPSLWAGVQQKLAAAEVADAERPSWRRAVARWAPVARTRAVGIGAAFAAAAVMVVWWRTHLPPVEPEVAITLPPTPVLVPPAPVPVNVPTHSTEAPSPDDVTASLNTEAARTTADYAQTAEHLIALASDASWSDAQRATFDKELAAMRTKVDRAAVGRPRQRALGSLIRFVQNAITRDQVALADVGGGQ